MKDEGYAVLRVACQVVYLSACACFRVYVFLLPHARL